MKYATAPTISFDNFIRSLDQASTNPSFLPDKNSILQQGFNEDMSRRILTNYAFWGLTTPRGELSEFGRRTLQASPIERRSLIATRISTAYHPSIFDGSALPVDRAVLVDRMAKAYHVIPGTAKKMASYLSKAIELSNGSPNQQPEITKPSALTPWNGMPQWDKPPREIEIRIADKDNRTTVLTIPFGEDFQLHLGSMDIAVKLKE